MPEGFPTKRREVIPEPEQAVEAPSRFENIVFRAVRNRKKEITKYVSSDLSRKAIEIPASSSLFSLITEGTSYTVEVGKDTNPDDPKKGALIVGSIEGLVLQQVPEVQSSAPDTVPTQSESRNNSPSTERQVEIINAAIARARANQRVPLSEDRNEISPLTGRNEEQERRLREFPAPEREESSLGSRLRRLGTQFTRQTRDEFAELQNNQQEGPSSRQEKTTTDTPIEQQINSLSDRASELLNDIAGDAYTIKELTEERDFARQNKEALTESSQRLRSTNFINELSSKIESAVFNRQLKENSLKDIERQIDFLRKTTSPQDSAPAATRFTEQSGASLGDILEEQLRRNNPRGETSVERETREEIGTYSFATSSDKANLPAETVSKSPAIQRLETEIAKIEDTNKGYEEAITEYTSEKDEAIREAAERSAAGKDTTLESKRIADLDRDIQSSKTAIRINRNSIENLREELLETQNADRASAETTPTNPRIETLEQQIRSREANVRSLVASRDQLIEEVRERNRAEQDSVILRNRVNQFNARINDEEAILRVDRLSLQAERDVLRAESELPYRFPVTDESEVPGSELDHRGALESRAKHLKRSTAFQAVADMLGDPELRHQYDLMQTRRQEMLALQQGDEKHRAFAPMVVGLMMGERTKPLFDMVIDHTVNDRSDRMKEIISTQTIVVPEVVIGSGVHGSIYSLTRQMVLPDDPALTLEREGRIGGQFGKPESDLFKLNSRTRPAQRDERALPGTRQTLNIMTDLAVTSPADTGMEAYQSQSVLADHARTNLFLSGEALVGAEVRRVRFNRFVDTGIDARYIVEFIDRSTGLVQEVYTDRVIVSSGLGEEQEVLDVTDATTRNILASERDGFENGEDAKVMSFQQIEERLGDPENPFPMQGFKNVILSGDGDGGKVLAGIFLGYEGQQGMSTMQLDRVEKLTWIGQSFPTKEAFIASCRARYHQLGLEFPRENAESYYSRIEPVPDFKAVRLERSGDVITVIAKDASGEERRYSGDHYVYSHGFKDKTDQILETSNPYSILSGQEPIKNFLNPEEDKFSCIKEIQNRPVTFFYQYGEGRVEFKTVDGVIEYTEISATGDITKGSYNRLSLFKTFLEGVLRNTDSVERIEVYDPSNVTTEDFKLADVNDGLPIATRYRNQEIYKVGPAAKLRLSPEEASRSEALKRIGENTAAVFRYAENTADVAKYFALRDKERGIGKPEPEPRVEDGIPYGRELFKLLDDQDQNKKSYKKFAPGGGRTNFTVPENKKAPGRIPYAMPARDILRFGMGSELEDTPFPETQSEIQLSVTTDESGNFEINATPRLRDEISDIILRGIESPYTQAALRRLMGEKKGSRKKKDIEITLPFRQAKAGANAISKLDTANISYSIVN